VIWVKPETIIIDILNTGQSKISPKKRELKGAKARKSYCLIAKYNNDKINNQKHFIRT